MAEAITGGFLAAVLLSLMPLALVATAVAYIALRIRDARSETPDPELGIKSAYHCFLTTGLFLALTGLTISVTDFLSEMLDDNKQPNQPQFVGPGQFNQPGRFGPQPVPRQQPEDPFDRISQRLAWPLVISGLLFALVSMLLIKAGTNDGNFPAVRRTFGGLRLVVGGLSVMTGVTLAIELLFQKDLATLKPFSIAIALIGIWFPASAVQLFLLKKDGKLPYYVPPKPKKPKKWDRDEDEDEDRAERRRPAREKSRDREREADDEERTERRRPPQRDEEDRD
jgi:hypothetical protein